MESGVVERLERPEKSAPPRRFRVSKDGKTAWEVLPHGQLVRLSPEEAVKAHEGYRQHLEQVAQGIRERALVAKAVQDSKLAVNVTTREDG